MKGYAATITCPFDGHEVRHVASSLPMQFEARAVAECSHCGVEVLVEVYVMPTSSGRARCTPARRESLRVARQMRALRQGVAR